MRLLEVKFFPLLLLVESERWLELVPFEALLLLPPLLPERVELPDVLELELDELGLLELVLLPLDLLELDPELDLLPLDLLELELELRLELLELRELLPLLRLLELRDEEEE